MSVENLKNHEMERQQQTPSVQLDNKQFRPILTAAQARKLTTLAQRHLNYEIAEDLWLGELDLRIGIG